MTEPPSSAVPFLGFDPGGNGKFGVAFARIDAAGTVADAETDCVPDAATAIRWAKQFGDVCAVGIDTLLA